MKDALANETNVDASAGFGIGALEDAGDHDVYSVDKMSDYDMSIGGPGATSEMMMSLLSLFHISFQNLRKLHIFTSGWLA